MRVITFAAAMALMALNADAVSIRSLSNSSNLAQQQSNKHKRIQTKPMSSDDTLSQTKTDKKVNKLAHAHHVVAGTPVLARQEKAAQVSTECGPNNQLSMVEKPSQDGGADDARPSQDGGADDARPSQDDSTDEPRPSQDDSTDEPRPSQDGGADDARPSQDDSADEPRPSQDDSTDSTDEPRPSQDDVATGDVATDDVATDDVATDDVATDAVDESSNDQDENVDSDDDENVDCDDDDENADCDDNDENVDSDDDENVDSDDDDENADSDDDDADLGITYCAEIANAPMHYTNCTHVQTEGYLALQDCQCFLPTDAGFDVCLCLTDLQ